MGRDRRGDDDRRFDPADSPQTVSGAAKRSRCASCGDRLEPEGRWVIQRRKAPDRVVCTDCAEEILDLPV